MKLPNKSKERVHTCVRYCHLRSKFFRTCPKFLGKYWTSCNQNQPMSSKLNLFGTNDKRNITTNLIGQHILHTFNQWHVALPILVYWLPWVHFRVSFDNFGVLFLGCCRYFVIVWIHTGKKCILFWIKISVQIKIHLQIRLRVTYLLI